MKTSIAETLAILPLQPGVYQMKDKDDLIIYVGKAKILRNRVRSYFSGQKDIKTHFLVSHIDHIDFIVTHTEYEALILENNLIKEHKPKYNINLKDGKTYPVIRITNEDFPRVFRTRRIIQDGSSYFGPFTAVGAIDQYLNIIEEYFPLRKCRGPLKKREQPCLYYHIRRCSGPCAGKVDKDGYQLQVDNIRSLLNGDAEGLASNLKVRMDEASQALRFEEAARLRDATRALSTIGVSQQVQDFDLDSRDFIAWASQEDRLCFVVFRMRGGKLINTDSFRANCYSGADFGQTEEAEQFLMQFYGDENPPPQHIYVEGISKLTNLQRFFKKELKSPCRIHKPEQTRDQSIINMARENARQELSKWKAETGDSDALKDLQAVLELPRLPLRIEGFDIAHLHGKHTVAGMVSFWKGIPDKAKYRIFHIRSLEGGIDDYESLREAAARRYTRVLNEELERPDLICIDGGKGQLSAVMSVMQALGLQSIPICALAKEEEEIFLPGRNESVRLPEGSPALRILQAVRDESHRFGTSRNQRLRSGDLRLSTLESISGIGPTRAQKLLSVFGNLAALRQASAEELVKKAGIPAKLADAIAAALHENDSEEIEPEDYPETAIDMAAENEPDYSN